MPVVFVQEFPYNYSNKNSHKLPKLSLHHDQGDVHHRKLYVFTLDVMGIVL